MWHQLNSSAVIPDDCDVRLAVIDGNGTVHPLVFPCRRVGNSWIDSKLKRRVEVDPTHWQEWEETMKEPGLDNRHRDKNGEISRKHGNTLVRTLPKVYGAGFAPGCRDEDMLSDVLHKFDEASLSQLHRDHDGRHLEAKIRSRG
jgi:hypothetical protein